MKVLSLTRLSAVAVAIMASSAIAFAGSGSCGDYSASSSTSHSKAKKGGASAKTSSGGHKAESKESKDIVDTAVAAGSFKTLVAAVKAADLVDTLKGDGSFTVFAPTDEAFAKLPKEKLEELLKPENKETLKGILTYHVVSGKVLAADAIKLDGKSAKTVNGKEINVKVKDGSVFINDAKVIKTDIETKNGVIHVIDTVIVP